MTTTVSPHAVRSEKHIQRTKPVVDAPILVIDDDEDLCQLLALALKTAGLRVETMVGPPSWEELEQLDPSVVFLDIGLGKVDGTAVCKAMKSSVHHASRPVVLISARPEDRLHAEANACDADAYLSKPFPAKLVVDLAKHYTALRNEQRRGTPA